MAHDGRPREREPSPVPRGIRPGPQPSRGIVTAMTALIQRAARVGVQSMLSADKLSGLDIFRVLPHTVEMPPSTLYAGDCLRVLPTLPADSIDAIVTDPPYGLAFMGKDWDHGVPGVEFWRQALRVAKPGAHLVAFGGTRTHHRLMVATEDAGWEIRDCLMWLYGSGFPKSLDVSKAIDKAAGAERKVVGEYVMPLDSTAPGRRPSQGLGYGSAIEGSVGRPITAPATDAAQQWAGWGTALKPAWEPIILARKPLVGTVASNVQTYGTGAINVDGCRIAGAPPSVPQPAFNSPTGRTYGMKTGEGRSGDMSQASGRWPANLLLDEESAALLDAQTGVLTSNSGNLGSYAGQVAHTYGSFASKSSKGRSDSGGASRFFYCAKASRKDRGEGNTHPTVKPTDLMRWLVRLVTPADGVVLDPFMGSGSTGKAATLEGRAFVGIDQDPAYVEIARARIDRT